jgi:hypothetical protein
VNGEEFRTYVLEKHYPTIFSDPDELYCLSLVIQHDFQDRLRFTTLMDYIKEK